MKPPPQLSPSLSGPPLAGVCAMTTEPSNLTMHRAETSVWDRHDHEHSRARTIGMFGLLLMAAGACLVAHAYSAELASLRGRVQPTLRKGRSEVDEINKAAEDSFPASDPPAWTPTVGKPAQP